MKKLLTLFFIIFSHFCNAQNERDKFIKDSILPILNTNKISNIDNYNKVKKLIADIEKKYGYETDLKKKLVESSYFHKDIHFFKKELKKLIKDHGFQIEYLSGDETYFNDIFFGKLTNWFVKFYSKNHSIWLKNNFHKVIDLKKINDLHLKDQIIARMSSKIVNNSTLDSLQKNEIIKKTSDLYFENIMCLNEISKKYNRLPNSKNFAIIQNSYETVLIHNFRENTDKTWGLLYKYFKKAYLNHEITNVVFQNYDFYCYLTHGYQEFNSFTIEQIPINFRKNNNKIPLKSQEEFNEVKKEFKWF